MQEWRKEILKRLAGLSLPPAREAAIVEELEQHLEDRYAELAAGGAREEEARRVALEELRDENLLALGLRRLEHETPQEPVGLERGGVDNFFASAWQDVRYGLRQLRRNPGFTAVAVLTMALAIGANTSIFTLVNGVLLKPLPYPYAERLVTLAEKVGQFPEFAVSYPDYLDWVRMNHSFEALAAYRHSDLDLTGSAEAERVKVTQVSAGFFPMLGVKPVIGREFSPDEDRRGTEPVVMLSGGFWKRKFGGSPEILGKTLTLGGTAYTVIGVIPQSFYFCCETTNFVLGDIYSPIGSYADQWMSDRGAHPGIFAIGRLKAGMTVQQARADMDGIAKNLAAAYPDSNKNGGITLAPLKERMVRGVRPMLLVLLSAVGFVLLVACANVASLLLTRAVGRAREFAIRSALGASRRRVMQQLLAESLLLALAGGGLGLLVALWGTKAGLSVLPSALPRANEVRLDPDVLAFTLIISMVVGLLFGLAPALEGARPNLQQRLKESGPTSSYARHRTQRAFVVFEMAMAVVLLVGAGLTVRSLARLWRVNPGFSPHNALTFGVALPPATAKENPDQVRASLRELTNTIAAVPGVKAVAITDGAFPMQGDSEVGFWAEGQPKPATQSEMPNAVNYIVDSAYFNVMGIPLLRGRLFTAQDELHSRWVAVIDENLARDYFPKGDAVGKLVHLAGVDEPYEIVGVVGHVAQWGLDDDQASPLAAQLYLSVWQIPDQFISLLARAEGFVVRRQSPDYASAEAIRSAIEGMNREQVAYDFASLDGIISASLAARRFAMILLAVFAALALALASIGIYGVVSYFAAQRTHEIGIRMALGAEKAEVLRMVITQGLRLTLIGASIGVAGALGLTRFLASLLYGVKATDPLTFVAVSLILMVVALLASYIPARRATKVDPLVALKYE